MNSLHPVGISSLIAALPGTKTSGSTAAAAGDSSFHSLLGKSSAALSNDLDANPGHPKASTAAQPAAKKEADPVNTALQNWNPQPASQTESLPLPASLSFNLFGPKSGTSESETTDTEDAPADAKHSGNNTGSSLQTDAPPLWMLPGQVPSTIATLKLTQPQGSDSQGVPGADADANVESVPPVPAVSSPKPAGARLQTNAVKSKPGESLSSSAAAPIVPPALPLPAPVPSPVQNAPAPAIPKSGLVVGSESRSSQNNPHIEAETIPASGAPAPHLAFALRLTPTPEQMTSSAARTASAAGQTTPAAGQITPAAEQAGSSDSKPSDSKQSGRMQESAAPAANGVQAQPQRSGAGGSNEDDHHPSNRESDAGPVAETTAPIPTGGDGTAFQASQAAVTAAPPAPAGIVPTQTPEQAPPASTQSTAPAHSDPPVKTGTANELSFSVPANDQQKVEVRVIDRAGEVRISVRTPNEDLASTLRGDLSSLTGKLNQSGYATEAFAPASHSGGFSRDQNNAPPDQQQGGGGQDRSANRQGQQQNTQQDGRGKRPAWLDELENSMASAPARKDQNQ